MRALVAVQVPRLPGQSNIMTTLVCKGFPVLFCIETAKSESETELSLESLVARSKVPTVGVWRETNHESLSESLIRHCWCAQSSVLRQQEIFECSFGETVTKKDHHTLHLLQPLWVQLNNKCLHCSQD